jgi:hypothetical protein
VCLLARNLCSVEHQFRDVVTPENVIRDELPKPSEIAVLEIAFEVLGRVVCRERWKGIRKRARTDKEARGVWKLGHVADMVEVRVTEDGSKPRTPNVP